MEDLKAQLAHVAEKLAELETAARKLPNQNFADLIKSAHGRIMQASEHPDVELVAEQLHAGDASQEKFPFGDGKATGDQS